MILGIVAYPFFFSRLPDKHPYHHADQASTDHKIQKNRLTGFSALLSDDKDLSNQQQHQPCGQQDRFHEMIHRMS